MTTLPNENLNWIQNGEPVSGGVGGNSEGVLNRPLVQLHNNVDAVRDAHDLLATEVANARGGEINLDTRLDGIDQEITDLQNQSTYEDASQAEIVAKQVRDRVPSSFDYTSFTKLSEVVFDPTTARNNSQAWTVAVQPFANKTSNFANHIAFIGNPKNLYVDGYKIILDARPASLASALINLGTAPSTGSRLDFAFIEVWKEKVVLGAADDVLFPNGAVNFEGSGTFNNCTLFTADASGGNNPAYLASSTGHGAYIKANDANIAQFLANPMNNVVKNGDEYYQIRWRIRVHNGVNSYLLSQAYSDSNIKAQGQLASVSAIAFGTVDGDAGLSRAYEASLALDGYVRAVPVAIVHRRNSTAWSLSNPNGSAGRPDGKTHDHIHFNDVCDLRHHGVLDNGFDYKAIYERNLNEILESSLTTSFEPLMSDSDGNGTYKDLAIYGTKLLRMDGLIGTVPMDAGWEVITRLTAENGVTAKFDGLRNYYSDVGGDQAVTGLVPALDTDGVNPTTCFTYVASTKTLTFDATDFDSGNTNNPGHGSRTYVSTRRPHLKWGAAMNTLGLTNMDVAGTWTGLGGDSASFVVSGETQFFAPYVIEDTTASAVGDVYTSLNGVTCTVTHIHDAAISGAYVSFSFTSTTIPTFGTLTKVSGTGPATITPRVGFAGANAVGLSMFVAVTPAEAVQFKTGVTYTAPDGYNYYVFAVFSNGVWVQNASATHTGRPAIGVWTKAAGTGPATFTPQEYYFSSIGNSGAVQNSNYWLGLSSKQLGSNVMPANAPIHISAYATFAPGSGFLSRIPHRSNDSFVGCHFNVNGTQVLPNNGVGFIPFGSTVDPVVDGNQPVDSHSRTTNLMGFLYKGAVMNIGITPNNTHHSGYPSVIKDGSTYKMWFSGNNGSFFQILYSESTDGVVWSSPQLAMTTGRESNGYDSIFAYAPSVLKDGSTYKMWYTGRNSLNLYRILYSESTDGITWSNPQLAMDIGTEPNGYNSVSSENPSVIKDGSTYKMWFSGNNGSFFQILYSESTDGVVWSSPVLVMDIGTEPNGYNSIYSYAPSVIKDGSTYKMWLSGHNNSNYRILHSTSTDGITWSNPQLAMDIGTEPNGYNSAHSLTPSVIKDGSTYKMWFTGHNGTNYRILHAVLTMTDTANVGSSTTGVYSTTGSLNHAPPQNSQVVVMYEALTGAAAFQPGHTYVSYAGDVYATTFGSGGVLPQSYFKSTIGQSFLNLVPQASYTYVPMELPRDENPYKINYLTPDYYYKKLDPITEVTYRGTNQLVDGRYRTGTSNTGIPIEIDLSPVYNSGAIVAYNWGVVFSHWGTWLVPEVIGGFSRARTALFGMSLAVRAQKQLYGLVAHSNYHNPLDWNLKPIQLVGRPLLK